MRMTCIAAVFVYAFGAVAMLTMLGASAVTGGYAWSGLSSDAFDRALRWPLLLYDTLDG